MQLIQRDSYGHIISETVINTACVFVIDAAYLDEAIDGGFFFSRFKSFFRGFTYDMKSQVRVEAAVIAAANGGYMISDFRQPRYSSLQLQRGFNYESPREALNFAFTILEDKEELYAHFHYPHAPSFLIYVSQYSLDAEIDVFISNRLNSCKNLSEYPTIFNICVQDEAIFVWENSMWVRAGIQHGEVQPILPWLGKYMVASSARARRVVKPVL